MPAASTTTQEVQVSASRSGFIGRTSRRASSSSPTTGGKDNGKKQAKRSSKRRSNRRSLQRNLFALRSTITMAGGKHVPTREELEGAVKSSCLDYRSAQDAAAGGPSEEGHPPPKLIQKRIERDNPDWKVTERRVAKILKKQAKLRIEIGATATTEEEEEEESHNQNGGGADAHDDEDDASVASAASTASAAARRVMKMGSSIRKSLSAMGSSRKIIGNGFVSGGGGGSSSAKADDENGALDVEVNPDAPASPTQANLLPVMSHDSEADADLDVEVPLPPPSDPEPISPSPKEEDGTTKEPAEVDSPLHGEFLKGLDREEDATDENAGGVPVVKDGVAAFSREGGMVNADVPTEVTLSSSVAFEDDDALAYQDDNDGKKDDHCLQTIGCVIV